MKGERIILAGIIAGGAYVANVTKDTTCKDSTRFLNDNRIAVCSETGGVRVFRGTDEVFIEENI